MKLAAQLVFTTLLAIAAAALNPVVESTQAGGYGERSRHQQCVKLRQADKLRWYGIASGLIDDGSGRTGLAGFHAKSCHVNEQSCQRWISNIYREIRDLDTLRTAYCKRVN